MATKYVVTYKMAYADGGLAIYEFFRGSKRRCDDIAKGFGGVTDERRPVKSCAVIVGRADTWDEFLNDNV
jgi:hypothetical protein